MIPWIQDHSFLRDLWRLVERVKENELTALAAQSTYYLVLSFFPFLIFIITLISYTPLVQEDVLMELRHFMPEEAFELVQRNVQQMMGMRRGTLMSTGMLTTVFIASNGLAAMMRGINKAYHCEEKRPFLKVRGMAVLFTLALALVIVLSLIFLVFGQLIGQVVFDWLNLPEFLKQIWNASRIVVALAVMVLVFSGFYTLGPNRRVRFRQSLPGAIFATLGWLLISMAFSYYVNHFGDYSVTYGSIGAIIVLLIWLYLSSIAVLLGGEINAWRMKLRAEEAQNEES